MPFPENPNAIASSTDEIIGGIFGAGWQNLLTAPAEQGSTGSILGDLLAVFSVGIIGVTIIVVGIVFLTALAETANKGKLGGDYSNMWLPIRSLLAPVLIFPINGGYSLIQMLLLAGIVNIPIQIADTLIVTAAERIVLRGGSFSTPYIGQVAGVGNQVLYSEICRSYYNNIEYSDANFGSSNQIARPIRPNKDNYIQLDGDPTWEMSYARVTSLGFVAEHRCGSYQIRCQDDDPATLQMCLNQATALHDMMNESSAMADFFIQQRELPDFSQVASIQARYQSRVRQAVQNRILANFNEDDLNERQEFIESVRRDGFFGAGKYYMTFTHISEHNASFGKSNLVMFPFDLQDAINPDIGIGPYIARAEKILGGRSTGLAGGAEFVNDAIGNKQRELARIGHRQVNTPEGHAESLIGKGVDKIYDKVAYNNDPLAGFGVLRLKDVYDYDEEPITGIQSLGNTLLTVSSAYFAGAAVLSVLPQGRLLSLVKGAKKKLGGKGKGAGSSGFILGGISSLMTMCFFLGAVLLYYIPSVPFIIWTMGCVGYLLTIFETLLAATIWIASHVMPAGQGLSSDHARSGYGLLINLAVRPPIMVIGLFGGAAVMHVAVAYFINAYHIYAVGLMSNRLDFTGLLTFVFMTAIEVSLIVAIIHKTHSAIFEAPDNVVRWITTMTRPTGEDQNETKVAAVFQQTASRGEQAAGASMQAAAASQSSNRAGKSLYN